jgi:hypothetical protein
MKMKLGKTSIILIAVGITVIVFSSLGVARAQQVREQERVSDELTLVNRRLNTLQLKQLQVQRGELEAQLSEATSQLEAVEEIVSQPINSIDTNDEVFQIANGCDVTIVSITSSGLTTGKWEGIPCSVITLNLNVGGDILSLINFVNRLNGDFTTGAVNSASLSFSGNTTERSSTAQINMTIYSYQVVNNE